MSTKNKKQQASRIPVPVRAVPRVIVQRKNPTRKTREYDFSQTLSDISQSLARGLNRPLVLLTVVIATAVILTHQTDFNSGFLGSYISQGVRNNNTLALWINKNSDKFLGLVIFAPSIIDSPRSVQLLLALSVVLWVMIIPQASIFEYLIQSIALHTYFRVNNKSTRIFIIIAVIVAYIGGFFKMK